MNASPTENFVDAAMRHLKLDVNDAIARSIRTRSGGSETVANCAVQNILCTTCTAKRFSGTISEIMELPKGAGIAKGSELKDRIVAAVGKLRSELAFDGASYKALNQRVTAYPDASSFGVLTEHTDRFADEIGKILLEAMNFMAEHTGHPEQAGQIAAPVAATEPVVPEQGEQATAPVAIENVPASAARKKRRTIEVRSIGGNSGSVPAMALRSGKVLRGTPHS
jgi:hypothetical protein